MGRPAAGLADGGCKFPTETAASTRKRNRGPRGVDLGPTAILRTRSMRTRASSRPWLPSASPTNALMRLRDLTWETCSPRLSECSYPTTTEAGAVTFVQDSSKSYGCRHMRCKAIASESPRSDDVHSPLLSIGCNRARGAGKTRCYRSSKRFEAEYSADAVAFVHIQLWF